MPHPSHYHAFRSGFTLIEMIVSLGIFAVVITMAIGSLLVLIASNQRIQGEQGVMTNLAFALDSMTREIRTGYNYYCDSFANYSAGGNTNYFTDGNSQEVEIGDSTQDCTSIPGGHQLHGVSFFEGGKSILGTTTTDKRILYFFDNDAKTIKRRVGNNEAQSVISSGLVIESAKFFVTGSEPQSSAGDFEQPTVTIFIEARDATDDETYQLQTTVTQRILDL